MSDIDLREALARIEERVSTLTDQVEHLGRSLDGDGNGMPGLRGKLQRIELIANTLVWIVGTIAAATLSGAAFLAVKYL